MNSYSWPAPPEASTTASARRSTRSPAAVRVATPTTRRSSFAARRRSVTRVWLRILSPASTTAPTRARTSAAPVASPPACSTRARECAASRPRAQPPSEVPATVPVPAAPAAARLGEGVPRSAIPESGAGAGETRSNSTPQRTRSGIRNAPSPHSTRTASRAERPPPAAIVSPTWRSTESSENTAAAMPPCAHRELLSSRAPLVTRVTECPSACARSAAVRPPRPEPTTTTSRRPDRVLRPPAAPKPRADPADPPDPPDPLTPTPARASRPASARVRGARARRRRRAP